MARSDPRQMDLLAWVAKPLFKETESAPGVLRQRLLDDGFAHEHPLELNRGLLHDGGDGVLNTRLCRSPVFYECVDGVERVVLRHADLAFQPLPMAMFDKGYKFDWAAPSHPHTIDGQRMHAQDLVNDKGFMSGALVKTWKLTTPKDIYFAVQSGMQYGDLSATNARHILALLSVREPIAEPADRSASLLSSGMINNHSADACSLEYHDYPIEVAAWGALHALEDGWVKRVKRGVEITTVGRQRMEAAA